MTTTRKQHSPQFKARVVIEAIRGQKTLSQLGSQFKVHPIQIAKWRKAALEQTICGQGTSGWRLVRSPEIRAAASPRGWINLQLNRPRLIERGDQPFNYRLRPS